MARTLCHLRKTVDRPLSPPTRIREAGGIYDQAFTVYAELVPGCRLVLGNRILEWVCSRIVPGNPALGKNHNGYILNLLTPIQRQAAMVSFTTKHKNGKITHTRLPTHASLGVMDEDREAIIEESNTGCITISYPDSGGHTVFLTSRLVNLIREMGN